MFTLLGKPYSSCDRVTRREALQVGRLALGGLTLADQLRRNATASPQRTRDTAVIQIFLGGGPSHIDMYDMKPAAPVEIRGEFREISTAVPGYRICEHLPRQAAILDKLAIVRSVTHTNATHLPASHWMQTGYEDTLATPGKNTYPSTGSVTARVRGPMTQGMPTYVAVPRGQAFSYAAYLGPTYAPFTTQVEPNDERFHVPNLQLPAGMSRQRLEDRGQLLGALDRLQRSSDAWGRIGATDAYYHEALDMITRPDVVRAFDIASEPESVRERYGRTSMGQNCLLARRLVEAGVSYVSCLSGGGWDTHVDNFRPQRELLLPRLDRAISALVTDLFDRGLDQRVLVNVMGEFGRTPKVNQDAGRDHWPGAFCALFAGGGLKMGQMIGTTDSHAAYPTSRPYSPGDVLATIYHVLGIDTDDTFVDHAGRPTRVLPNGQAIPELI